MRTEEALERLQQRVVRCRKCPRLVTYLQEITNRRPKRYQHWDYWGKPLPSFGDPQARLLIVGLAPAAHGGARTGRMFTGDRSGEWLFSALHEAGFSNRPRSDRRDDDLALMDCYITATIHCAPPKNKPLPQEIENCRPYLLEEFGLLTRVRIILTLGQIAFTQTLRSLRVVGYEIPNLPFGHGRMYRVLRREGGKDLPQRDRTADLSTGSVRILATYHPSQQNTQTGRLTRPMFRQIFERILETMNDGR